MLVATRKYYHANRVTWPIFFCTFAEAGHFVVVQHVVVHTKLVFNLAFYPLKALHFFVDSDA